MSLMFSSGVNLVQSIVQQEMVFRACKHILRRLVHGQSAENSVNAVSHFLNCLLGAEKNSAPEAVYDALDFQDGPAPAYTRLTPQSVQTQIVDEIAKRFRWHLEASYFTEDMRKAQLLRELATRIAFQLDQREYDFAGSEDLVGSQTTDDASKSKKVKKTKTSTNSARTTTFEPTDILTMLPVVKSTAPSAGIAEEVFEAGRITMSQGDMMVGLELMLEGINMYEQTHQVVHPEVAAAYNTYAVTMNQLVRLRTSQLAAEGKEDADPSAGLDVATAIKLQRQAVMVAERTLGLHHSETIGYYFTLAMLELVSGDQAVALRLFKYVLHLWDVVYGQEHPEMTAILVSRMQSGEKR
jgi:protein TIF31